MTLLFIRGTQPNLPDWVNRTPSRNTRVGPNCQAKTLTVGGLPKLYRAHCFIKACETRVSYQIRAMADIHSNCQRMYSLGVHPIDSAGLVQRQYRRNLYREEAYLRLSTWSAIDSSASRDWAIHVPIDSMPQIPAAKAHTLMARRSERTSPAYGVPAPT
jgi:hypothetical protein